MEEKLSKEGYIFKGKLKGTRKFKYVCSEGHEGTMRKDHWDRGVRCAQCAGNAKLTIEEVRLDIEKEGYKLITKEYKNSKQILITVCPQGHEFKISRNNWTQGYRCSVCSGRRKKSIEEIKHIVEEEGYKLLSKKYLNNKSKIDLICPKGHEYSVSYDNWSSKNSRCPKCSEWGTSIQEEELYNFVKGICPDAKRSDRSLIAPYELDIIIPSKKIAIEYCGLYWHSELMGKDRNYHIKKKEMCNEIGYKLLMVFEDEFVSKKDILFSRMNSILGNNSLTTLYGRSCYIKSISSSVAAEFCNNNHLQGYVGSNIKLGAFYKGKLVAVMTFSKPSLAKGYKHSKEGVWELSRFCSLTNHRIVGIPSKMIKFFIRNYNYTMLFSYADYRWSDGNMYNVVGFSYCGKTKPNYWYFKNNKKRIHRFALRKNPNESKDITEWELRKAQGWNRIWDCGNLKYKLEKANIN
jgi:hypothetical protein